MLPITHAKKASLKQNKKNSLERVNKNKRKLFQIYHRFGTSRLMVSGKLQQDTPKGHDSLAERQLIDL